ncbi:MAG: G5 domain-containing protein [Eubacteriales bacterium]|nr:G5 domain-containing protein [Eubacteriales bacterium]MDY3332321.1 G5 domain-containing protein [Gallibacter sp.]
MINLNNNVVSKSIVETIDKTKKLKRKTKQIACVAVASLMLTSFVTYDIFVGTAYAAGDTGEPYAIIAGDKEIAVVDSKANAEMVIDKVKASYGKTNPEITAIVTPALKVEEKEFQVAEIKNVKTVDEATDYILKINNTDKPIFEVRVENPLIYNQVVAHDTEEVEDDSLLEGKKDVKTEGVDGINAIVGKQVMVNGKTVYSNVYSTKVVKAPVKEVIAVGTKVEKKETTKTEVSGNRQGGSSKYSSVATYGNVPASGKGAAIAATAKSLVGGHMDCVSLASRALAGGGIHFRGWPEAFLGLGTAVPSSAAQPGDIIVYKHTIGTNGGAHYDHVAVYIGGGMAVHGGYRGKVVVSSAYSGSGITFVRPR